MIKSRKIHATTYQKIGQVVAGWRPTTNHLGVGDFIAQTGGLSDQEVGIFAYSY